MSLNLATTRPPQALVQTLGNAGLPSDRDGWKPLAGGRTNKLWRFQSDGKDYVCKLYDKDAATPLFPNDPKAEALALTSLLGTDLAPTLRFGLTWSRREAIVYEYVHGDDLCAPEDVAAILVKLHDQKAPQGLRSLNDGPLTLLEQGAAMLNMVNDPRRTLLQDIRPSRVVLPAADTVFLHGDPVPANVIAARTGPCLIDWQCPAIGDPSEDLAIFLSPAMQTLYGGAPLDETQIAGFLAAYGHPDRTARYLLLARAYHWRMAAYCLWKAALGNADYAAGFDLELDRLKVLC